MEEEELDIFPDLKEFKMPTAVQSVYRSNGYNVSDIQKKIDEAVLSGGKKKSDMIIGLAPAFDEILGGSNYSEMVQAAMKRENRASKGFDVYNSAPSQQKPQNNSTVGNFTKTIVNEAVFGTVEGLIDVAAMATSRAEEFFTGLVFGDRMKGVVRKVNDTLNEKEAKAVDEFFESIELNVDDSFSDASPLKFDEDGSVNFDDISDLDGWLNTAAQTIGFMVPTIITGGSTAYAKGAALAGKAGKAASVLSKIKAGRGLITTGQTAAITMGNSFIQTFPDYQKEGLENGLSFRDATNMSSAMSLATGALEAIGMDAIFKSFGLGKKVTKEGIRALAASEAVDILSEVSKKAVNGKISKEVFDTAATKFVKEIATKGVRSKTLKTASDIARSLSKSVVKGGLPEGVTETLQTVSEDAMKRLYNNFSSNASEESSYRTPGLEEYAATALFSGFVGAIFGSSLHAIGGSSWEKNDPNTFRQSLFHYVDANIRTELAKNKQASFEEVYSKVTAGPVIEDAVEKGKIGPEAVSLMKNIAKVSYDANVNTEGIDNVDIDTRWNMFESSRRLASTSKEIESVQKSKLKIDEINAAIASTQDHSEITNLKTQKLKLERGLGKRLDDGSYELEMSLKNRYEKQSNAYDQFLSNISDGKSASSFIKNFNLVSDIQSEFKPDRVSVSSDGNYYSFSEEDGRVMKMTFSQVDSPEKIETQLTSGKKYSPIQRLEKVNNPMIDYEEFKLGYDNIINTESLDYEKVKVSNPAEDLKELTTFISRSSNDIIDLDGTRGGDLKATPEIFLKKVGSPTKALEFYNTVAESAGAPKKSMDEFLGMFSKNQREIIEGAIKLAGEDSSSTKDAPSNKDAQSTENSPLENNLSRNTQGFFSDVVSGGSEKFKPKGIYEPIIDTKKNGLPGVVEYYDKNSGNFDNHIFTSIPGFREIQILTASAVSKMYQGKNPKIYDIGGSEGGWIGSISSELDGKIKGVILDPNPEMKSSFDSKKIKGVEFIEDSFYEGFDNFKKHDPLFKSDVVHESMVFQFISDEREGFVQEVKNRYIKSDGIFLTEEKLIPEDNSQYLANEEKKNSDFKSKYYSENQLNTKKEEVLVGMQKNQAKESDYMRILQENFKYVDQYWDSGNFKGIIATDNKEKLDEFISNVGDTTTEFSSSNIKPSYLDSDVVPSTGEEYFKAFSDYFDSIQNAETKLGLQSEPYTIDDVRKIENDGGKFFITSDKMAGAFVKSNGYMGGLFKNLSSQKKNASSVLQKARIDAGGRYFDAYGTKLEDIYIGNGFEPVARIVFNDEFAPDGWNTEDSPLKDRPDVVFFAYNPDGDYKKGDGKYFDSYEKAEAYTLEKVNEYEKEETSSEQKGPGDTSERPLDVKSEYIKESNKSEAIDELEEVISDIEKSGNPTEEQIDTINSKIERQLSEDVRNAQEQSGYVDTNNQGAEVQSAVATDTDRSDFDNFIRGIGNKIPNVKIVTPKSFSDFSEIAKNNGAPETSNSFVAKDGSVVFNPDKVSGKIALHEVGHIWVIDQKLNNPEIYGKGISLVPGTTYEEQVRSNSAYDQYTDEEILEEALVRAIEDKGSSFVTSSKKRTFSDYINNIIKRIKDIFSFEGLSEEDFNLLTIESFAEKAAADIVDPKTNVFSPDLSSESISSSINNPLLHHDANAYSFRNFTPGSNSASLWSSSRIQAESALSSLPADANSWTQAHRTLINSVYQSTGYRLSEEGVLEVPDGFVVDSIDDMREEAKKDYAKLGPDPSKEALRQIHEKTGFKEVNGKLVFSNPGSIYFRAGKKIVSIPRSSNSSRPGKIRSTIEAGFFSMYNSNTRAGKSFKFVVDSVIGKYLLNNESFVLMLDTKDGLIKDLIHNTKRYYGTIASHVETIFKRDIHELRTLIPDSTLKDNSNSVKDVRKVNIKRLIDDGNGGVTEEEVRVPLDVAIEMRQLVDTQLAEGVRYGGATMIIDNKYLDQQTNKIIPGLKSSDALYRENKSGIKQKTGARVDQLIYSDRDELIEGDFTKEVLMTPDSYEEMVSQMDQMEDVPEAIAMLKSLMNNSVVSKAVSHIIEISDPNRAPIISSDYHPIRTFTKKEKGRSGSKKIEDSTFLQEREGTPVSIVANGIFESLDSHVYELENSISHYALVNNLESLQNSLIYESDGLPEKTLNDVILSELSNQIDSFTDFRRFRRDRLDDSPVSRYIYGGINKFTASIFRFNFGIQFKQIGTYMSIYGQDIVDNDIVRSPEQVKLLMKLSAVNPVMETFTGSGSSVIAGTDVGLKTALGNDTTEAPYLREIFGDGKTGSDLDKHWELFGSIIQRLTGAHNGYIQGVDFPTMRSLNLLPNIKNGLRRFYGKADDFFEKHGMAAITKADRGVIITYYEAAKKQAQRDLDNGLIQQDQLLERVAYLTEELMYKTNQIGKVAELTSLQRSGSILSRIVGLYSGQTQRLLNQSIQATLEYFNDPSEKTKKRMFQSTANNFLLNTFYVSLATSVYTALKKFAFGDDQPEEPYEFYAKKIGFDFARNFVGMGVGLPVSNVLNLIISDLDNEAWTDELIEVPGVDVIQDFILGVDTIVGSFAEDDPQKAAKKREKSVFGLTNSISLMSGFPKIITDLTREWFTEDSDDKQEGKKRSHRSGKSSKNMPKK